MSDQQIPRAAEIIGAGLDSLATSRPGAFRFANNGLGRYADVFTAWDAQAQVCLSRLTREAAAKRLGLAAAADLTDLARSEYVTERDDATTTAFGQIFVSRPNADAGSGAITKGMRLFRAADPSHNPPIPAATFVVTQDCPIGFADVVNQTPIYIKATGPGAAGNSPDIYRYPDLQWIDTPFDPTLTVGDGYQTAGGADSKGDDNLRAEAYAYALGQYGPTLGSILAGALRGTGVRHVAIVEVTQLQDGTPAAFVGINVADASWGGSEPWVAIVQQQLQDPETGFVGVGPVVVVSYPDNIATTVTCTVMLQDSAYLAFTGDITGNIQTAVQSYFDDRPDWYTWSIAGLRSAIAKSDSRIRSCTDAGVFSAQFGTTLFPPPPLNRPFAMNDFVATHQYLIANGVQASFVGPA